MSAGRFLLSLLSLLFLLDSYAQACTCPEMPPSVPDGERRAVKAGRNRARVVFLGELVRVEARGLTFRVERTWKGTIGRQVTIMNPRSNARGTTSCDRSFSRGWRYVVFAQGTSDTDMRDEGACSQTRAVTGTEDSVITLLDELDRTDPVIDPRRPHDVSEATLAAATVTVANGQFARPVLNRQHDRELSGIQGVPVEGHDIAAGIEITGTKQLDLSRSGWNKFRERLRANGADLRLGWPIESQTVCRFKEVVRDVMSEKGFLDVEIDLDTRRAYGNRRHVTLRFTIVEGERSRPTTPAAPLLPPAQRCMR